MVLPRISHIGKFLGIFLVYCASGILAEKFLSFGKLGAPIWPASGVALAALLVFGWRYWPVVGLGTLFIELSNGVRPTSAILISFGNISEVLAGYYLLTRISRFKNSFDSLKDVLSFIFFGALVSPLASASFGALARLLVGQIPRGDIFFNSVIWWLADAVGILLTVPFLLVWKDTRSVPFSTKKVFEALIILSLVTLMSFAIFGPVFGAIYHSPAAYFIFPFFLWISIRFGQPLSVIGAIIVTIFGIWGTANGHGPFAVGNWVESIFHLQTFLMMLTVTGLVFSAIVTERKLEREDLNRHLQIEKALRESEEKFRTFNVHLERRVAERTRQLERTNRELEEFAYITSHDLQEPLRAVTSFGVLLEEEFGGVLPTRAQEYLKFVVGGAQRMQSLIGDLLNYSRLGGGNKQAMSLEDLQNLVEEAKANLIQSVKESDAEIVTENLPSLRVERDRVVQVFQNLIGNAIKFRGNTRPRIRVTGNLKDSEWEVCVSDNGIGIGEEYKDKIFQIFQRLHARTEYPGSGIGLSICKKIIERMHGKIWVESELGVGSRFYFTIPIGQD